MRLGILSDIHSNFEALESAYKALSSSACDKIVCAGDVVGYGAMPKECIDFIRDKQIDTVRGNHDHYVASPNSDYVVQQYARDAINWTKANLDSERLAWLGALPFKMAVDGVTIVHASLEALDGEYWPYILDTKSAMFHFFLQEGRYAFFGHTHIPLLFTFDGGQRIEIEILRSRSLKGGKDTKFLINPGSVGQPRDFDSRSSCCVFDTATGDLALIRTAYDVQKVQGQILAAGLPTLLAARLSRGN